MGRQQFLKFTASAVALLPWPAAPVILAVMAAEKPAIATDPEWGRSGLLISFAADGLDGPRKAEVYASKILPAERPGDLPVEQASECVLVTNAQTAKKVEIEVNG